MPHTAESALDLMHFIAVGLGIFHWVPYSILGMAAVFLPMHNCNQEGETEESSLSAVVAASSKPSATR